MQFTRFLSLQSTILLSFTQQPYAVDSWVRMHHRKSSCRLILVQNAIWKVAGLYFEFRVWVYQKMVNKNYGVVLAWLH